MKPDTKLYTMEIEGKTLIFETGNLAAQAGGAVTIRFGDTLLFCAATMDDPRPGINFFPLMVDYEERMYAGGRIPGSFFRREGRPTENAVLVDRLIDRPIRPLFPKDMRNEVQVILYSLSADEENIIDVLALNAASAALMISDIPWKGPVGAVRVGRIDGDFIINPTYTEMAESDLDLRVAGTRDAILMVEAGADEVPEDVIVRALEHAHKAIQPLIDLQEEMVAEVGKDKREYQPFAVEEELETQVAEAATDRLKAILAKNLSKTELNPAVDELRQQIVAEIAGEDEELARNVKDAFQEAYKAVVRERVLKEKIRPDGRKPIDIRDIWCEVGYSPRSHGSGIFTRGETQIMTLATLGTPRDAQRLDNLTPTEEKRYMHHYNFPPFSVGEVRFLRGASRREIGHGALAERALIPVLPPEEEFPYTLRLVSECMSSNGSTSMASVCGSTLALMDGGVPITSPVSGIAMGLVSDGNENVILSDIQGLEDHLGDMDFKVAGTSKGITALQMDIKISGLNLELMAEALEQAKQGRAFILQKMLDVIPEPRPELKEHAPHISILKIPVDKIGAVIGPGGKTIRAIQDETDSKIDIDEDGTVYIATTSAESDRMARERVEALVEEAVIGRIYTGKVVRTTDFGAFVEILPGQDGLVHISQLDTQHVRSVEDVVKEGEEITVMVTNIDPAGKIRLSRQAVLEGWTAEEAAQHDRGNPRSGKGKRGRRSRRN